MAETKNVTLRLPLDLAEWLTSNGESVNQAVISCAKTMRRIRSVSTGELKGVFTENEWKFFADSLNGTVVNELFRCNVSALVAHCEDAERYDGAASKWGVDIVVLCEKIKSLKGANIDALYTRVESFWANPANIDKWAKF